MKQKIIVDTGPLVAYLNRTDNYHEWVKLQLANITSPLLTCEAVITEACFLLRNFKHGQETLLELVRNKSISIEFNLNKEIFAIKKLLSRYNNVPISLADACLIRLSEIYNNSIILTLDSDFHIYRKNNRHVIPTLYPN